MSTNRISPRKRTRPGIYTNAPVPLRSQRGRPADKSKVLEAALKRQEDTMIVIEDSPKVNPSSPKVNPSSPKVNPSSPKAVESKPEVRSVGVQVSLPCPPSMYGYYGPLTPIRTPPRSGYASENEDEELRKVIELSKLTAPIANCSADGAGTLCTNKIDIIMPCGHGLCQEHSQMCPRCDHTVNVASRRLQRAIKKYIFRIKLRRTIKRRNDAAKTITGFFRIIKAKKIRKQLHREMWRKKFMEKLTKS